MKLSFLKASDDKVVEPPVKASAELFARHEAEGSVGWETKMGWLKEIIDSAGKRGIDFNELSQSYKQSGHAIVDTGYASTQIVAGRRAFVSCKPNPVLQFLTMGMKN